LQSHLPGYVGDYDKLTKAGAEVIACLSINDAFVMAAWGTANGSSGKVQVVGLHSSPTLQRTGDLSHFELVSRDDRLWICP